MRILFITNLSSPCSNRLKALLLVGHTGNQVDQLFSILTTQFKSEITTIESLKHKIERTEF